MRTGNRSNALLVELLIVVMFFMLSAPVLLQVFSASRSQSERAGLLSRALNEAQNVADRLYAGGEAEETLRAMDFWKNGESWEKAFPGFQARVTSGLEQKDGGVMRRCRVQMLAGDDVLVTLPVSRYEEVRP